MIIGTAGHIDHGKTTLVRALTGVDTDRLAEEQARGMTIDLGFAYLPAPDGSVLGFVDMPGHEKFMRNMLAGATGIDLVLLVVAADDGVMPQTREHLAVAELLGIPRALVAITKCDAAGPARAATVEQEVRGLLASGPFANAQILHVSAHGGDGIEQLRACLFTASTDGRKADDRPVRFAIDRAFSLPGAGTVVTGTGWSGGLRREAAVRILPGEQVARVRGLESHGSKVDAIRAGHRVAVAQALHGGEDHHDQAGRRAVDGDEGAADAGHHHPTDDGADDAAHGRKARGHGDAQTEGQRNQENQKSGDEVGFPVLGETGQPGLGQDAGFSLHGEH